MRARKIGAHHALMAMPTAVNLRDRSRPAVGLLRAQHRMNVTMAAHAQLGTHAPEPVHARRDLVDLLLMARSTGRDRYGAERLARMPHGERIRVAGAAGEAPMRGVRECHRLHRQRATGDVLERGIVMTIETAGVCVRRGGVRRRCHGSSRRVCRERNPEQAQQARSDRRPPTRRPGCGAGAPRPGRVATPDDGSHTAAASPPRSPAANVKTTVERVAIRTPSGGLGRVPR